MTRADGLVLREMEMLIVDPRSPFSQDELFGPAVAVSSAGDWESAIASSCTAGPGKAR